MDGWSLEIRFGLGITPSLWYKDGLGQAARQGLSGLELERNPCWPSVFQLRLIRQEE